MAIIKLEYICVLGPQQKHTRRAPASERDSIWGLVVVVVATTTTNNNNVLLLKLDWNECRPKSYWMIVLTMTGVIVIIFIINEATKSYSRLTIQPSLFHHTLKISWYWSLDHLHESYEFSNVLRCCMSVYIIFIYIDFIQVIIDMMIYV